MCGIIGATASRPIQTTLLDGLSRMAYRGYDSAGIATLTDAGLHRRRAPGAISALIEACRDDVPGCTGIGHTRWATHGRPDETNAHPHVHGRVAVVHNGIIENHQDLRKELAQSGYTGTSATDSEVIPMLIQRELDRGLAPFEAFRASLSRLEGSYAIAALIEGELDTIFAARHGSPLAVGMGETMNVVGSDAASIAPYASFAAFLADGDCAIVTPGLVELVDGSGHSIQREIKRIEAVAEVETSDAHEHHMRREIFAQPDILTRTLQRQIDQETGTMSGEIAGLDFREVSRLILVACGSSYYACMAAKYWIESASDISVEVDLASELRYRRTPALKRDMAILVSQSGETADTLAALTALREAGAHIVSLVNVAESSIARESHQVVPLLAGPEISVASTKAVACQMALLAMVALKAAQDRGSDGETGTCSASDLLGLGGTIAEVLEMEGEIAAVAKKIASARSAFFLGRGALYPVALEGALKLKEISYIHAEGYAAGELKHGPLALITPDTPVIVLTDAGDPLHHKTMSNAREVAARGGQIYLISTDKGEDAEDYAAELRIPGKGSQLSVFAALTATQLLSYHVALHLGREIDMPRNLAKSVTVE